MDDKNLSASAGDTGLIPGPGRFYIPWSNKACIPQCLGLHSRALESELPSPHAATSEAPMSSAPQQEKPLQ